METSASVSVTSGEFASQIRAVTDPLSQQLAHLRELLRELKNEQMNRRHDEITSSKTDSSSSGSGGRSDSGWLPFERKVFWWKFFCWYVFFHLPYMLIDLLFLTF